jgi:vesicle coat complex subunit
VDFVRKSVRAISRCAIKLEQSAERCVSTLLDLIQTKVNYVVQEAIVVIKDIFKKYPNKSIIATRASWILSRYLKWKFFGKKKSPKKIPKKNLKKVL